MTSLSPEVDQVCVRCDRPFRTRWRYTRCSTCRYLESYKDLCACGAKKSVKSITCIRCAKGGTATPRTLSASRAAWLAGLLEGEGTFVPWAPPRRGGVIRVQMTDEDVIVRVLATTGVGRLETFTPKNPRHKQSWRVTVQRAAHVLWLTQHIAPLMCSRRRAAIERLRNNFADFPPAPDAIRLPTFPDQTAVAWAAGLIEGEGWILPDEIGVQSTDRDVLERLLDLTGVGQVHDVNRQKSHHRDSHVWRVTRRSAADDLLTLVRPWLGERRGASVDARFS